MKVLAFDLDGTIADTLPGCLAVFRKAVQPYGGAHAGQRKKLGRHSG